MSAKAVKRLSIELKEMVSSPPPLADARPDESNLLRWVFVLDGAPDTPFEGGEYIGELVFPEQYPYKPPSIKMTTPSGRFKTGSRLCFSMSDFHPEAWSPMWGVRQILIGLNSFMSEEAATFGSITTSDSTKRELARSSHAHNVANAEYQRLFPTRYAVALQRVQEQSERDAREAVLRASSCAANAGVVVMCLARVRGFLTSWRGVLLATSAVAVLVAVQTSWATINGGHATSSSSGSPDAPAFSWLQ